MEIVKVHSEKYSTWYIKTIWKIQYKFTDASDGTTRPYSHVTALLTFHILKDNTFSSVLLFYKHF